MLRVTDPQTHRPLLTPVTPTANLRAFVLNPLLTFLYRSLRDSISYSDFLSVIISAFSMPSRLRWAPYDLGCRCALKPQKWWGWWRLRLSLRQALKDFHLTQQQYESMLQLKLDHPELTYASVACLWMQLNSREIMAQWLPRERHMNDIVIGGIFPIKGNEFTDMGVIPGE